MDAIKSLVVSFDPNDNTFSLSMQEKELYKITNLTQSLTDVFTSLAKLHINLRHLYVFSLMKFST